MDFEVVRTEPLRLIAPDTLLSQQLMSPYVWNAPTDGLSILVRAVPQPGSGDLSTGRIWYGRDTGDGLSFTMDEQPLLAPEAGALDVGGCEDPTVVPTDAACVVYYTGLDAAGAGQMLYAVGPDVHHLTKQGVALASFKTESNTKEATVELAASGSAWAPGAAPTVAARRALGACSTSTPTTTAPRSASPSGPVRRVRGPSSRTPSRPAPASGTTGISPPARS